MQQPHLLPLSCGMLLGEELNSSLIELQRNDSKSTCWISFHHWNMHNNILCLHNMSCILFLPLATPSLCYFSVSLHLLLPQKNVLCTGIFPQRSQAAADVLCTWGMWVKVCEWQMRSGEERMGNGSEGGGLVLHFNHFCFQIKRKLFSLLHPLLLNTADSHDLLFIGQVTIIQSRYQTFEDTWPYPSTSCRWK